MVLWENSSCSFLTTLCIHFCHCVPSWAGRTVGLLEALMWELWADRNQRWSTIWGKLDLNRSSEKLSKGATAQLFALPCGNMEGRRQGARHNIPLCVERTVGIPYDRNFNNWIRNQRMEDLRWRWVKKQLLTQEIKRESKSNQLESWDVWELQILT